MEKTDRVWAFNEWMRLYIEEPEKFEAEFRVVQLFLAEESITGEPSYGAVCDAFLESLVAARATA